MPWFNHLYNLKTDNKRQEYSQISINYMALLGLIYLVLKETKLSNKIHHGWSLAIVMLLITYLLPGDLIVLVLNKTDELVHKWTGGKSKNLERTINVVVGYSLVVFIIIIEAYILEKYKKQLVDFAYLLLIKIPKTLQTR